MHDDEPGGAEKVPREITSTVVGLGKIGLAAIPLVGGSVVEAVGFLQDRRLRRAQVFYDHLVEDLRGRVEDIEARVSEEAIQDLVDDALERATRVRDEKSIRTLATVVATAIAGWKDGDRLDDYHALVSSLASLHGPHIRILRELGVQRNINGDILVSDPGTSHATNQRALSFQMPDLAQVMDALLAELRASGMIDVSVDERPIKPVATGLPDWHLTDFGVWVVNFLREEGSLGHGGRSSPDPSEAESGSN